VFFTWRGFMGPKGLKAPEIAYWDQVFEKLATSEEWRADTEKQMWASDYSLSAETRKHLDRENELKPPETVKISAAIKPKDAAPVAKAIVRGIEHDQLVITADFQTAVLARAAGLLGPYVRRSMDRTIRRVRGTVAKAQAEEDE